MAKELGYIISLNPDKHKDGTEAFLLSAFGNSHIIKWAYILQDKEQYSQHDLDVKRLGLNRTWAEGFPGIDKYASIDEYIEEQMNKAPKIGDKKADYWRVLIITDSKFGTEDAARIFGVSIAAINTLLYKSDMADGLRKLVGEDRQSLLLGRHHYSDDEVKSNFDIREFMAEADKGARLDNWKRNFDPAMIFSLALFIFFIAAAVKYSVSQNEHPWILPAIIGGIGILYQIGNIAAIIVSRKKNRHVSGIPFIGGIHLLIAGLTSPCRWLAILCLTDITIWNFILALFPERKSK